MNRILVPFLATLLFPVPPSSLASEVLYDLQDKGFALTVVRGRVVCLDNSGHELNTLFGCTEGSRFGFAATDGRLYKFMAGDTMAPLFTDSRVRQRELQIAARLHDQDQLEIIKAQSVKAGKLYDIFYYCEVCSITEYVPGLCPCCRNPLEFRETPQ